MNPTKEARIAACYSWLRREYPNLFNGDLENPLPLAIGIREQIFHSNSPFSNRAIRGFLEYYTSTKEYHQALTGPDAKRYGLSGVAVCSVSLDHQVKAVSALLQDKAG